MMRSTASEQGVRRFGRVNWLGLATLMRREVQRFLSVWTQTIAAPLVTAGLFLVIFSIAVGQRRGDVLGVDFTTFIAPGVLMMAVLQNAFANTSSSVVISKVQGNIVDTLMPPLSPLELVIGYLSGGIARGLLVAISIWIGQEIFMDVGLKHPIWALIFVVLGAAFLSGLGLIAGIFADKFDQMAAITNFIVTPLAFLSGTFYTIDALPPVLRAISYMNPMFYLIDGGRYSVIGVSDTSPLLGFSVGLMAVTLVCFCAWRMLHSGYRLKN